MNRFAQSVLATTANKYASYCSQMTFTPYEETNITGGITSEIINITGTGVEGFGGYESDQSWTKSSGTVSFAIEQLAGTTGNVFTLALINNENIIVSLLYSVATSQIIDFVNFSIVTTVTPATGFTFGFKFDHSGSGTATYYDSEDNDLSVAVAPEYDSGQATSLVVGALADTGELMSG